MANFFSKNLAHIRNHLALKQSEMASRLNIGRSTYANYENGNTEPKLELIEEIVLNFGIDAGALLFSDISQGNLSEYLKDDKNDKKGKANGKGLGNLNAENRLLNEPATPFNQPLKAVQYGVKTPKVITLDRSGAENIVYVPVQARAGYLTGYGDPKFIERLESFNLPGLRNGTYRMFEIEGVSMSPTLQAGDRSVCKWVENFDNIQENRVHVVVTKDGIVVKRVLNRLAQRGKIVLKSDTISHRKEHPTYEINPEDILEIWYCVFKVSADFAEPSELYHRMADMEADLVEMREIQGTFMQELREIKAAMAKK